MQLSQQLLDELEVILREEFGKILTKKEVVEIGHTLVSYFDLLAKINYEDQRKYQLIFTRAWIKTEILKVE
jgi:hypothetical protein